MKLVSCLILLYAAFSVWTFIDSSTLIADVIGQAQLHIALGGMLFALLLALLKYRRLASALCIVALINLGWIGYSLYNPKQHESHHAFSLLAYNVWIENQQHDDVIRVIRSANADIVWLHEVSNELYHKIHKELKPSYPYLYPEYMKSKGSLLLTKMPHDIHFVAQYNYFLKHATISIENNIIDLIGVHLTSPKSDERVQDRNDQLDIVKQYMAEHIPQERAVIVAGDFNSAPWRPAFQDFMKDTQLHFGTYDILLSWPAFSLYPLMFPIDHVMARQGVCIAKKTTLPSGSSDHFPVLAQVKYCN